MKVLNGRFVVAVGVALALVSLLAFSLSSPDVSVGLETDVGLEDDAGDAGAAPPASLPETGNGLVAEKDSPAGALLMSRLGALGVALVGAGLIANRRKQRLVERD